MPKVTLDISKEFYEFAKAQAELFGYCDTEDYLTSILNMSLLGAQDEFEKNATLRLPTKPSEAEQAFFAELEEDEGGGLWHKDALDAVRSESSDKDTDLDDGIPF